MATTVFLERVQHVRDLASERRTQVSAIDISRAYFNASTEGAARACVMLLPEHVDHGEKCGLRRKQMYVTHAAADGWQQEYAGFVRGIRFRQDEASSYVFVDARRSLVMVSVYGTDFTTTGPTRELNCFENQLEAKY